MSFILSIISVYRLSCPALFKCPQSHNRCGELFIYLLHMPSVINVSFVFLNRFVKILLSSVLMGIFFRYVIYFFNENLLYEASFKAIYLIGAVVSGLIFYLLIAILIKAFKKSDINLNY